METQKTSIMPLALVISAILISASVFYLGYSINNNKASVFNTETAKADNPGNTGTGNNGAVAQNPSNDLPKATIQKVKLDNDPIEGKKEAPVTIVEFSDYECPFCKRHFQNVYPEIKKNYIDTGKVKLVFRDLPLTFHDPAATKDAIAANCAREQGGDAVYFKLHDATFTQTAGNGTGMTDANMEKIMTDNGVDVAKFKECTADTNGKQKAEVSADSQYGNSIGASGTPTFFIGKSTTTGEIDGELIVGAQPYSAFQQTIDKYLK